MDLASLPYQHHGLPGSLLDVALNVGVPLEHVCGGNCACTTCHVIVTAGDAEPEPARGRRGRPARHRVGPHAAVAPGVPGGRARRRRVRDPRLHAELRGGRRRDHAGEAREVRHRPARGRTGGARELDRRRGHRHRAVRGPPGRRSARPCGSRSCGNGSCSSRASTATRRPRTRASSRPSRWPGTRSGRTRRGVTIPMRVIRSGCIAAASCAAAPRRPRCGRAAARSRRASRPPTPARRPQPAPAQPRRPPRRWASR